MALRVPTLPSGAGRNFGHRNRLMPLTPFGASGRRASTRWMTLPPKSWSPEEMKILVPVIATLPSPFGTARVASRPRSVPAEASVSAMAPVHSPETIFGR
jgi:hypothetical protein